MKIKYGNKILSPNRSKYCIDCVIYEYAGFNRICLGLCSKTNVFGGFYTVNDCDVLEL